MPTEIKDIRLDLSPAAEGPLRITLTNVQHAAFASRDSICFTATINIDGIKAGTVENDGHGGANQYHPWQLGKRIDDYAKTLPPLDMAEFGVTDPATRYMTPSNDIVIDELLADYLEQKRLQRLCKTKVVFRIPGHEYKKGEYHTLKGAFTPAAEKHLVDKYGPTVLIINKGAT